ncbi:MAG: sulfatase [Planctomycetota bacterium]|nr:sulfatase [Planctomycetota bacterium]
MRTRLALFCLSTCALASCGGDGADGERERGSSATRLETSRTLAEMPNVVVVLIDTLRADHLAAYGGEPEVAPFLARLAQSSLVFRNAFSSSSWTGPSTASLFTGLYPTRHGLTRGLHALAGSRDEAQSIELRAMPEEIATLPELYKSLGYSTWGYAANLNIGEHLGFDRGFDEFVQNRMETAIRISAAVQQWRPRMLAEAPYFLYLHLNDVHMPNTPMKPWYEPAEDELADQVRRYDSEISYIDHVLEGLYQAFGWDHKTLLVILSDHGEEFRDHGYLGHGFSLYQELMKVVMIVHAPDLVLDGKAALEAGVVEVNVSLVDVVPTLIDVAGAALPETLDGRSLLALFGAERGGEAERRFDERFVFGHRLKRDEDRELFAVVWRRWKLVHDVTENGWMLFDLEEDPKEQRNVLDEHGELVLTLRGALDRLRARRPLGGDTVEVELDSQTLDHLAQLGYFDPGEETED